MVSELIRPGRGLVFEGADDFEEEELEVFPADDAVSVDVEQLEDDADHLVLDEAFCVEAGSDAGFYCFQGALHDHYQHER